MVEVGLVHGGFIGLEDGDWLGGGVQLWVEIVGLRELVGDLLREYFFDVVEAASLVILLLEALGAALELRVRLSVCLQAD